MSKKISELNAVTTLEDTDVMVVNHTDSSQTEPVTETSKITIGYLKAALGMGGKADKVTNATNGNVATLNASGNLVDSGKTLGKSVPADAVFTDTTYSDMIGAGASAAGTHGLVPAPAAGDQNKVLSGAGTWVPQPSGGVSSFNSRTGAVSPAAGDYNANQVGAHGLYGITMLASNANLNDYVYPTYKGEYYYNIAGHSISNMPTGLSGKPFRLIVESLGDSAGDTATGTSELDITYANCTLQTLIVTNLNNSLEVKTYRRRGYNSGLQSASWTDWVSYEDQIAALNSGISKVVWSKTYVNREYFPAQTITIDPSEVVFIKFYLYTDVTSLGTSMDAYTYGFIVYPNITIPTPSGFSPNSYTIQNTAAGAKRTLTVLSNTQLSFSDADIDPNPQHTNYNQYWVPYEIIKLA